MQGYLSIGTHAEFISLISRPPQRGLSEVVGAPAFPLDPQEPVVDELLQLPARAAAGQTEDLPIGPRSSASPAGGSAPAAWERAPRGKPASSEDPAQTGNSAAPRGFGFMQDSGLDQFANLPVGLISIDAVEPPVVLVRESLRMSEQHAPLRYRNGKVADELLPRGSRPHEARLVEERDEEHAVFDADLGLTQEALFHLLEDPRDAFTLIAYDPGVREHPYQERVTARMDGAPLL